MNVEEFYLEDLKSKFAKINPSEYYLSYSGGRDSHILYWFVKEYLIEPRIEVVSINTCMEIPEIRDRMHANADRVLHPVMKPFVIKEKYGIPCVSKSQDEYIKRYRQCIENGREIPPYLKEFVLWEWKGKSKQYGYSKFAVNKALHNALLSGTLHKISPECCKYMKKLPARAYEKESGKKPIIAIMANESLIRKQNHHACFDTRKFFYPIWDLSDEIRGGVERMYNIEVPKIYQYVHQTGCAGCPYGLRGGNTQFELAVCGANQREFVMEYFKESYDFRGFKYQGVLFQ